MSGLGARAKEHEPLQQGQLPPGSTQTHCLQTEKETDSGRRGHGFGIFRKKERKERKKTERT